MTLNDRFKNEYLPASLVMLMVLTRFHHFGDFLHLPDASLAVFFLAGFYRAGRYGRAALFGFLLGLAGLIDYLAIANGTSAWCVSPAYVFLLPTYWIMWRAGRYCAGLTPATPPLWLAAGMGLMLASSLAFVVSNGSFFLFSGRFADMSWLDYSAAVVPYYLPYVGSAALYVLAGFGLVRLTKLIRPVSQFGRDEV